MLLNDDERAATISFIRALRCRDGGYASRLANSAGNLQDSLSAIKTLQLLGATPTDKEQTVAFICRCQDETGGFCGHPGGTPTAFATAAGLIALHDLGARKILAERSEAAARFLDEHASTAADFFMLIAAHDEAGVPAEVPLNAVSFFREQQRLGTTGVGGVQARAIAAGALLRAHVDLDEQTVRHLLQGQRADGGFADADGTSDLMTTYTVMRTLSLLNRPPDLGPPSRYIASLRRGDGGYAELGDRPSAGDTYQAVGVLHWIATLRDASSTPDPLAVDDIGGAVQAARRGATDTLSIWLAKGGDPNRYDDDGWTPLLAAAARGRARVVELLLFHDLGDAERADPELRFVAADALPIYMAGQSGDLDTVRLVLRARPHHLFEISEVNGHTVLLQAAFFGSDRHRSVAQYLLDQVADILSLPPHDDAAIEDARQRLLIACNVRGYNPLGMARLWGNEPMASLFARYDRTTEAQRDAYLRQLLDRIKAPPPHDEAERVAQALTEEVVDVIKRGFETMAGISADDVEAAADAERQTMSEVRRIVQTPGFNINRLGGPLGQPPLIVAVTGVDQSAHVARLRNELARFLLDAGADPDLPEKHPMGVDAVIRAAVLNHFDILQLLARYMTPGAFAAALNEEPAVNGQTALLDSVHRALTASTDTLDTHLEQIRWTVQHGARSDIEDHTGQSPAALARSALRDPVFEQNALKTLEALGLAAPVTTARPEPGGAEFLGKRT